MMNGNGTITPAPRARRVRPYSHRLRQEAFDLYSTGLSRRQVTEALRQRYGTRAPHDSTLKRWMARDRWTARRRAINSRTALLDDRTRATGGTLLATEMRAMRDALVGTSKDLPFRSAEGAIRSLATIQRTMTDFERSHPRHMIRSEPARLIEALLDWLQQDEVLGPVIERRRESLQDRIIRRLAARIYYQ
jgi:hypothetical protein